MRHRTLGRATAAALGAALLLSACGGSDDEGGDDIVGAKNSSSASPDGPAVEEDPDAPAFDFPGDLKADVEPADTGDDKKDAVLRDQGYALSAMVESYGQQKATANFDRYWQDPAYTNYVKDFERFADEGQRIAGTGRYFNREVRQVEDGSALVVFCEDQGGGYVVDAKTGERIGSGDGENSAVLRLYRQTLTRTDDGTWTVTESDWTEGDGTCR
ncbi:hypothetical protein O7599_07115 [Streptomyces sp. WMMC500]|uniref:hypothetical protein n=1 Tax=Streptomyces sp. WMMC500 TaxID=3015154 RepID=UPI00248D117A|nr:hypothetical protein [Streptomyces sp. WMMC500]WBB62293.1 hypothetical protein O7599_07115 [Streptomyces sp. WMMC500]